MGDNNENEAEVSLSKKQVLLNSKERIKMKEERIRRFPRAAHYWKNYSKYSSDELEDRISRKRHEDLKDLNVHVNVLELAHNQAKPDTPQQNNDLEDEENGSEHINNMEYSDSEKERKIDDEKDEEETNENDCDENEDIEEDKSKGVERRERGVSKNGNRWLLQKFVNKKQRHIANYKTLAEANEASIIFHESL